MEQHNFEAVPVGRGYAMGPVFRWRGWPSVLELLHTRMPVVLVADYLDERMVAKIDVSRIYAVVVEHGSIVDPLYKVLLELDRPSLIGASGVWSQVDHGEFMIVDAAAGHAIVRPTQSLLERYKELKGSRAPQLHEAFSEVLRRLAEPIQERWIQLGRQIPFDLPEQRQVYNMAQRLCAGGLPTDADDALLHRILYGDGRATGGEACR